MTPLVSERTHLERRRIVWETYYEMADRRRRPGLAIAELIEIIQEGR